MKHVRSDGFQMAYQDWGEGPALVLLHGWGSRGSEFEQCGWTEVFANRRLLVPDLRGHGASAKPHDPRAYQPAALAADVLALLETEQVAEADVFGYSLGAAVALWLMVQCPDRVRSAVLGGPPAPDVQERISLGRALRGAAPPNPRAEAYREFALSAPGNDLQALAACLEGGLAVPPLEELAVFGGEALVVAGTEDRRFAAARELAERLPGGRFLAVEGADHMGAFADARVKQAVAAFLDEVSPGGPYNRPGGQRRAGPLS